MVRWKSLLALVAVASVVAVWVGQAISQQEDRPRDRQSRGEARRQRDPEEMRRRMEQWRQRAAERIKENLGASEEEWKVLQPRIEKVQTLSRQLRFGAMRGRFGDRSDRRGDRPRGSAQETATRPQSDLEKKSEALGKIVENKESKTEEIKSALKAFREAREKVEKDLANARKDLREVVTVRQEAQLVLMGVLD
ncbi:MAG: hypothetical protein SVV80_05455 [Planctomycetota bacterium]|nr:hypothetical protein [Planctomycetota bacterium]